MKEFNTKDYRYKEKGVKNKGRKKENEGITKVSVCVREQMT